LNESGATRKQIGRRKTLSGEAWADGLNRLVIGRDDLPVTLQGGEPTLHKDFYVLVDRVRPEIKLDLLTNFMFDLDEFIARVDPKKFTRQAKYAAIRASYHPGQNDIADLIEKTLKMAKAGFYVGLYTVATPSRSEHIAEIKQRCTNLGIDFRTKEYLGFDGTTWHGTYKYPGAIDQQETRFCQCRTTELIIGPDGSIYRCHADLYAARSPIGHLLSESFSIEEIYRPCYVYGHCNPCDVKVKTNRFQEFGHTSVDIIDIAG
jgi:MoaA/NifB/PqqE/SkfB family radical SAM enzyme